MQRWLRYTIKQRIAKSDGQHRLSEAKKYLLRYRFARWHKWTRNTALIRSSRPGLTATQPKTLWPPLYPTPTPYTHTHHPRSTTDHHASSRT